MSTASVWQVPDLEEQTMPIPRDHAVQADHNRCWRCAAYDRCETGAHREAFRNFILCSLPMIAVIDAAVLFAAIEVLRG